MKIIRFFLVLMGVCMFFQSPKAQEYNVTAAHQALAMENGWLNVSRPLTAEDLKGRIILVDFWTFCCINCIQVIPDLHYLEEKFGDKLLVIGVHSAKFLNEKESGNIRDAVLRYDIEHPVVNDKDFKIWKKFGVRAWPSLMLINPQGMIAAAFSGEGHRQELEREITALIAKNDGKTNKAPLPIALEKTKEAPTELKFPGKLAYAKDRDLLFVSDSGHHRLVAMNLKGAEQFAIGSGTAGKMDGGFAEAQFFNPQGIAYAAGKIYVADTSNHLLREVDLQTKTVRTIAGTGVQGFERRVNRMPAMATPLASPWDVEFYPDAGHLVIAMAGTHQLWTYDVAAKTVSVLAGNGRESIDDGKYPDNSLSQPSGLSAEGGKLYFVDSETSSLRVLENGEIKTLVGTGLFDFGMKDGKQGAALLQHPLGLYTDSDAVYIADSYNHALRRYDIASGTLSTLVGAGKRGVLSEPNDILKIGKQFYIADTNHHQIKRWNGKALEELAVMVKAAPLSVSKVAAEQLPSFTQTAPMQVKAGKISVQLVLPAGWKVNKEAPSYLALYAKHSDVAMQVWQRPELEKLQLPAALKTGEYLLQGTLYYCEDKPGAPCLIRSFSQVITAGKSGAQTLPLDLK